MTSMDIDDIPLNINTKSSNLLEEAELPSRSGVYNLDDEIVANTNATNNESQVDTRPLSIRIGDKVS